MGLVTVGLALTLSKCIREYEERDRECDASIPRVWKLVPVNGSSFKGADAFLVNTDVLLSSLTSDTNVTMERLQDNPRFIYKTQNKEEKTEYGYDAYANYVEGPTDSSYSTGRDFNVPDPTIYPQV